MASSDNQAAPEQNVSTLTMNEALDAQANGSLPDTYSLSDARAELGDLAVADVAEAKANAQALIDGATLPNNVELTLVPMYDLNDSLQNIYDADPAILHEKNGYTLSQANVNLGDLAVEDVTAAKQQAQALVDGAQNSDELTLVPSYNLDDTLQNIYDGDPEIVNGRDGYTLTDEAGDLGELSREEAVLVQGAMNADDYQFEVESDGEDDDSGDNGQVDDDAFTLEDALEAENGDGLPDDYTLASGEIELGALSLDDAEDALDDLEDIVEDADNADELTFAPEFTLKDTLDEVLDADDDVAEHMNGYELTNQPGDLGELSGEEAEAVAGASNADDYTFSREIEVEADEEDDVQVSATAGDDIFEFDDVDDIRDLEDDDEDDDDEEEDDSEDVEDGDQAANIVIDGFNEEGNDTLEFSADDLNDLVEDATDRDAEPFNEDGQLTGDQLYVAADASSAPTGEAAFIFDTETDKLSFDADGQGGHDAVELAMLNGVEDLGVEDFNIA